MDDDEKGVGKADTLGGYQYLMLISESGLYTLIMRSNKPEAKVFRKWVTSESPAVIQNGSGMPKKTLWRWLERIEKARRISLVSYLTLVNVPTATGAKSTTFYNLNVLNQLAMVCRVCRDRDMSVINGKEYSADLAEYSESRVFFVTPVKQATRFLCFL